MYTLILNSILEVSEQVSNPLIIDWINTLNPAINTKKLYLQVMQDFTV